MDGFLSTRVGIESDRRFLLRPRLPSLN
jgi:hypothetical protein